jgi:hypothetical protein
MIMARVSSSEFDGGGVMVIINIILGPQSKIFYVHFMVPVLTFIILKLKVRFCVADIFDCPRILTTPILEMPAAQYDNEYNFSCSVVAYVDKNHVCVRI